MIYKIIRLGLLVSLFVTFTLPILLTVQIPDLSLDFRDAISQFLIHVSSYLQNVRGLINQFLYAGLGQTGINVFNTLIWCSLMIPIFGLSARLGVTLYKHFF